MYKACDKASIRFMRREPSETCEGAKVAEVSFGKRRTFAGNTHHFDDYLGLDSPVLGGSLPEYGSQCFCGGSQPGFRIGDLVGGVFSASALRVSQLLFRQK